MLPLKSFATCLAFPDFIIAGLDVDFTSTGAAVLVFASAIECDVVSFVYVVSSHGFGFGEGGPDGFIVLFRCAGA